MTEVLRLDGVALLSQGPTVSLTLAPGQSLAVMGPPASGKSRFLRCVSGAERPAQGLIHVAGQVAAAGKEGFSRRSSPQSVVRHSVDSKRRNFAADALSALGLWEARQKPLSSLSPTQLTACELLPCLASDNGLMLLDGQLDRLDPWTLNSVISSLRKRMAMGAALVASINRPELLPQFDNILLLHDQRISYGGSVRSLLSKGPGKSLEVESNSQPGVRAIAEPFNIQVKQEGNHTVFQAAQGQELAAQLLLEGYGDVKFVVLKESTPEQALMHVTKTAVKKLSG
jgi:ABC-type multidrug transport system ATPase subunit